MAILVGKNINLRALEPEDLDFLFSLENNEDFWEISSAQIPYSRHILKKYIQNAHQDIYEAKQFRFVICNSKNLPVGLIDLFDFNPQHMRVGVGIILAPAYQGKGFGEEALEMIIDYAFTYINVHQIYANILEDNKKSKALFEKFKFKQIGVKKDWIFSNSKFKNEILYQLIRKQHEY